MAQKEYQPAKSLQSSAVGNSLRRNIIPMISKTAKVLGCRALWQPPKESINACLLIAEKRMEMDRIIQELDGVDFFLSSITGTTTNCKSSTQTKRQGISYFIVYQTTKTTTEETIFQRFHDHDIDALITTIKTMSKDSQEATLSMLKQVVKDHNSSFATEVIKKSVEHCIEKTANNEEIRQLTDCNKTPCRLVVANQVFSNMMRRSFENLKKDGMLLTCAEACESTEVIDLVPNTGVGKSIETVKKVMQNMNHALHRGSIYRKAPEGDYSYIYMCTVECYLESLLDVKSVQDEIISNFHQLQVYLCSKDCYVIKQLSFNYDLIEVLNGKCFKLSSLCFIDTPLTPTKRGVVSPRAFHSYDRLEDGLDAGVFAKSIMNSFPDDKRRIQFINKFYQCLLYQQLPQKTKKLVACGSRNSGKTSWSQVFFGLLGENKIATVSKEKQFALAMVDEATELLLIDEWKDDTLPVDTCKTFLQGGWTSVAKKHKNAVMMRNNLACYLCCNFRPKFGVEQDNVYNRLEVFDTIALKELDVNAPTWIHDNSMKCVAWMAHQINCYKSYIPVEELFYLKEKTEYIKFDSVNKIPEEELTRLRLIQRQQFSSVEWQPTVTIQPIGMHAVAGPSTAAVDPCDMEVDKDKENNSVMPTWIENLVTVDCMNVPKSWLNTNEESDSDSDIDLPKKLQPTDINTVPYLLEVRRVLKSYMGYEGSNSRLITAWSIFGLKFQRCKGRDYLKADPEYDAWMCVKGVRRRVFDSKTFVCRYPSIMECIVDIRKRCSVSMPQKDIADLSDYEYIVDDDEDENMSPCVVANKKRLLSTSSSGSSGSSGSSVGHARFVHKKKLKPSTLSSKIIADTPSSIEDSISSPESIAISSAGSAWFESSGESVTPIKNGMCISPRHYQHTWTPKTIPTRTKNTKKHFFEPSKCSSKTDLDIPSYRDPPKILRMVRRSINQEIDNLKLCFTIRQRMNPTLAVWI